MPRRRQRRPTVTEPVAKQTVSVEVQTDLTWPAGEEYPQQMPRCSTACQTVSPNRPKSGASAAPPALSQTNKSEDPRSGRHLSPPFRTNTGVTASPVFVNNHLKIKAKIKKKKDRGPIITRPPPHANDPVATCSKFGVLADTGESMDSDPDIGQS